MNPLIVRGIRERLRFKNLISSGLFSLILCSTLYLAAFGQDANHPACRSISVWRKGTHLHPDEWSEESFTVLLILPGLYLMFWGPGDSPRLLQKKRKRGYWTIKG